MKNQKALYLLPIKESGGKDMVKAELWRWRNGLKNLDRSGDIFLRLNL